MKSPNGTKCPPYQPAWPTCIITTQSCSRVALISSATLSTFTMQNSKHSTSWSLLMGWWTAAALSWRLSQVWSAVVVDDFLNFQVEISRRNSTVHWASWKVPSGHFERLCHSPQPPDLLLHRLPNQLQQHRPTQFLLIHPNPQILFLPNHHGDPFNFPALQLPALWTVSVKTRWEWEMRTSMKSQWRILRYLPVILQSLWSLWWLQQPPAVPPPPLSQFCPKSLD